MVFKTQLQLNTDFVPTSMYDETQFPPNSFVIKVSKAALDTAEHQKLPVYYHKENRAYLVKYDGSTCTLMSGSEYCDLRKADPAYSNKLHTRSYTGVQANVRYYRGLYVYPIGGLMLGTAKSNWLNFIYNVKTQQNFTYTNAGEWGMVFPNRPVSNLGPDKSGFTIGQDLYKIKLPAIMDKYDLLLDGEWVIPVKLAETINPQLYTLSQGKLIYFSSDTICAPFLGLTQGSGPDASALLVESKLGDWIEPLSGKRVDYIVNKNLAGAAEFAVVNPDLAFNPGAPGNYNTSYLPTPEVLGLKKIDFPDPPGFTEFMNNFVGRFIDFKTLFLCILLAYFWTKLDK